METSLDDRPPPDKGISALERSNAPVRRVQRGTYTGITMRMTMRGADADPSEVAVEYPALRTRIVELLASLDESVASVPTPACPDWTVRELVSHIVGVPEDVLAGRTEGIASEQWTQAQVARHTGETLAELREHLLGLADDFDPLLAHLPAPINGQFLVDAVTHEHDLREAVSMPGAHDSRAVTIAAQWLLLHLPLAPEVIQTLEHAEVSDLTMLRALSGRMSRHEMELAGLPAGGIAAALTGPVLRVPPD